MAIETEVLLIFWFVLNICDNLAILALNEDV